VILLILWYRLGTVRVGEFTDFVVQVADRYSSVYIYIYMCVCVMSYCKY
jgi:hypothetical protein